MLQLYYYLVESRDINCWVYDKVSRKEKQIETERERGKESGRERERERDNT